MASVTVDVDLDLDEFGSCDLIDELESRGYVVQGEKARPLTQHLLTSSSAFTTHWPTTTRTQSTALPPPFATWWEGGSFDGKSAESRSLNQHNPNEPRTTRGFLISEESKCAQQREVLTGISN